MIHFTSDNHFFHKNVINFCNRPYDSVEHMNSDMIDKWNGCVSVDDTVYCLGDFAFSNIDNIENILKQLNYKELYIVTGNHDRTIINQKNRLLNSKLVTEIVPYKEIQHEKNHINLFHYACRTWNKAHYGSWLLYGHTHGTLEPFEKSVDVGVDAPYITGKPEYRPFSFIEVQQFMQNQKFTTYKRNQ